MQNPQPNTRERISLLVGFLISVFFASAAFFYELPLILLVFVAGSALVALIVLLSGRRVYRELGFAGLAVLAPATILLLTPPNN